MDTFNGCSRAAFRKIVFKDNLMAAYFAQPVSPAAVLLQLIHNTGKRRNHKKHRALHCVVDPYVYSTSDDDPE